MSITDVTEDWTYDSSDESSADESRLRIAGVSSRAFDVIFDADCTSAAALSAAAIAAGVPDRFDLYPGQTWLFADQRHAERTGPLRCRVTITYTSVEDPLNADPEYSWSSVSSQEPRDRDNSDDPIENSSGEPIDPPVTDDTYDLVLSYRDNISAFAPIVAEGFVGSVNTDTFLGFIAGKVKCTKYTGTPTMGTIAYVVRDMEFVFRNDTWTRKFLDEGFRDIDDNAFLDDNGKPMSLPVKLDGSGSKLATGGTPVFNTFDLKKTAAFASLGVTV